MRWPQALRSPTIAKPAAPDTLLVIPSEVEESLDRMTEDRKTLEMREQMSDLERLRHSASYALVHCHSERSREWSGSGSRDMDGQAEG